VSHSAACRPCVRTFRRDRGLASRLHPSPSRTPHVRWQQTLSAGPQHARKVDRLPPDYRGPRVSWPRRPAPAPATSPVPRSARPSNEPPVPHGRRTDGQPPPVLEPPRVILLAARAPPTPARHPQRHTAVVGPMRREASPAELGLRRPGHEPIPSCDQSPNKPDHAPAAYSPTAACRRLNARGGLLPGGESNARPLFQRWSLPAVSACGLTPAGLLFETPRGAHLHVHAIKLGGCGVADRSPTHGAGDPG